MTNEQREPATQRQGCTVILDIFNPNHTSALRRACAVRLHGPFTNKARDDCPILKASGAAIVDACNLMHAAYDTLDDHAQAAELIWQLVKRAGVPIGDKFTKDIGPFVWAKGDDKLGYCYVAWVDRRLPKEGHGFVFYKGEWTSTIARLLALDPDAGPGPVLKALQGES